MIEKKFYEIIILYMIYCSATHEMEWSFPGGSAVRHLPAMQETCVQLLGWEDSLEKGMATQYCCQENGNSKSEDHSRRSALIPC